MNYTELTKLLNSYGLALNTMMYDALTIAPKQGAPYRNEAMALLNGEYFKLLTSDESIKVFKEAQNHDDAIIAESAKYTSKEILKIKNIPEKEYVDFVHLTNDSQQAWEDAKSKNDYSLFEDNLIKLIASRKKLMAYREEEQPLYTQLLSDYEDGLTLEKVDDFFEVIKTELVPFIDIVIEAQGDKPDFLTSHVPIEKQKEISKLIMDHLSYSFDFGYLAEAEHPFSSTFSINDTRITTHYKVDDFTSNIFSVIHEVGHSLYNHNVNPKFEGHAVANNMSYSMHESQSRFLENNIGRSKEFWIPIYGKLQAIIPTTLSNISLDEFILGINYVERSAIRTESDELTYPLHILVRYELEKMMFESNETPENLNIKFRDLMKEYIGINVESDDLGILQDVHWSDASFGYFPTYALGSAYAAQFMVQMEKDIPLKSGLMTGDLKPMFIWLKNEVHQYGGFYQADTILNKATNESFNPHHYINYLKEKYSQLLGI
ncbi:carboxypeptidase M32 [Erysipelothrix urinaevulpis]|uniref:carboxypeptidase M32 n=1 Tax=Erysipelothrix urinaevulpis TaxID=2683717 RepID=UPI00135984EE|nr:carboxypeptidase M32 [Erysipelothrix urinaevulpis]